MKRKLRRYHYCLSQGMGAPWDDENIHAIVWNNEHKAWVALTGDEIEFKTEIYFCPFCGQELKPVHQLTYRARSRRYPVAGRTGVRS